MEVNTKHNDFLTSPVATVLLKKLDGTLEIKSTQESVQWDEETNRYYTGSEEAKVIIDLPIMIEHEKEVEEHE